ncbi:Predicted protein [Jatrophihabitans endophyticus]|uniref:Phosphodiester glycosidase domain-containing protein n=1 Tax=Jatrophihabitans endophyticus TaxID=1206085 RepID=A0A1M5DEE9_9ACTN|nr:phosphodiester glycosidase family protein [Jatrophihabitans endophyticus]SHF65320.1 Predicted protein [Jatrophihabitans endophyticus]
MFSALVLVVTLGSGVAAATAPPAAARAARSARADDLPADRTLAGGVTVNFLSFRSTSGRQQRAELMHVDLTNRRVDLAATVAHGAIGAPRQTVVTQVRRARAIGGINTDFFDLFSRRAKPRGGVISDGEILKSPRRDWDANLYVRHGRAAVGQLTMTGTITRAARKHVRATTAQLFGVNTLSDLARGRIVLVTAALAAPRFGRACTVVTGTRDARGRLVVAATYSALTAVARRSGRGVALVACGRGARATWLHRQVVKGDRLTLATTFPGGTPQTLVSGGRVLIAKGRRFDDAGGEVVDGPRNPETFACVSRNGRQVVLGVVDGFAADSAGVSYAELTAFLLGRGCWSGIVFDGGGSSTLVGRASTHDAIDVYDEPADGDPRAVPAGLVVRYRA